MKNHDQILDQQQVKKRLTPEAERALAEAEERRQKLAHNHILPPKEIGGRREGPDPARYGDWERGGIICDF